MVAHNKSQVEQFSLEPNDARDLATLCGQHDQHLQMIEEHLNLKISNRGNRFRLEGDKDAVKQGQHLLKNLYAEVQKEKELSPESVHLSLSNADEPMPFDTNAQDDKVAPIGSVRTRKSLIKPRGKNQKKYIDLIRQHDINFGVGPAGTGKTYLAVACAVEALEKEQVERILLVRPAVEAGEKLGFLPGDLSQKVDPYLRPLYDALYEMLGFEKVDKLIEKHVIEIAPLAYMRGRTLNNAFIILDESQNTTREQMKMFLTRIGFGSTAVITGDVTQVDLPKGVHSGLKHSLEVLENVEGISFTFFASKDVVRHKLVQRIVDAYDVFDQSQSDKQK